MSMQFFPLEGALASATAMRTALANSVLHLFQDTLPNPGPSTPLADYTANEADYAGYASITLAAWFAPILAPGTGYVISSPQVQFAFTPGGENVGNTIKGCYLVDSTGKLRVVIIFTDVVPMQMAGQGIPLNISWYFPTGL